MDSYRSLDSTMVEAVVDSAMVEHARDTTMVGSELPELPAESKAFLDDLEKVMAPVVDTLQAEFASIRSLPDVQERDAAIQRLERRWYRMQDDELDRLLELSAFTSRMWIASLQRADTAFESRVREILAKGGKSLDYCEGFSAGVDIGARMDLVLVAASPALAERLRLQHQETFTLVYNDAGITAPMDTLVGRILGWERFSRSFPGTPHAAWADTIRAGYLSSLVGGTTNTPSFDKEVPDPEFLEAWKRLAADSDGPSGQVMREWLQVLESGKWRLTPRARAWLGQRGYSLEEFK
ncbi:MAG TPA: hypothetical protein PKO15_16315 [Fibrobacteria bacterium]|nr:hypothetical protein [Fibrobacteria bacterium]HOX53260.1 hypothetical protein [Fibrobacteria bacterium]